MIELGLVPILGVLALTGLFAWMLSAHGARIELVIHDLDTKATAVLNKDRENDRNLVNLWAKA